MICKVGKSKGVLNVTAGVWVLVVAVFAVVWYMMLRETFDVVAFTATLVVALAVLACLLCFFLMSPRRVELTADALVLHRVLGRKVSVMPILRTPACGLASRHACSAFAAAARSAASSAGSPAADSVPTSSM